jgi:HAD superfamily hydrolase (TIGR01509 family)
VRQKSFPLLAPLTASSGSHQYHFAKSPRKTVHTHRESTQRTRPSGVQHDRDRPLCFRFFGTLDCASRADARQRRVKLGFIFDLDGTLADTMPAHYQAWNLVLPRYGLTFPEGRFYALGGVPTGEIARILVGESGQALDADRIACEKQAAFIQQLDIPGAIRPLDAVVAIARRKRAEGPLAVASGGTRDIVQRTLAALGIADWFHAVVAAEDTSKHKPNPDVFLEAARRIDIEPPQCTVYEDTDLGLEAARRAGMQAVDVRVLKM